MKFIRVLLLREQPRSVVQTAPAYIEVPYTFGADGYQKDNLYLDTSRGIPSTDTAEDYTFEIVFQTYGFVNDMNAAIYGRGYGGL